MQLPALITQAASLRLVKSATARSLADLPPPVPRPSAIDPAGMHAACPVGSHADLAFPPRSRAAQRVAGRRRGARRARFPGLNLSAWRAAHAERCAACASAPRSSSCYFRALASALEHGWRLPLQHCPAPGGVANYKSALAYAPAVQKFIDWLVSRGRMRRCATRPYLTSPLGTAFRSADLEHLHPRVTLDVTQSGLNDAVPPWSFTYDSVAAALSRFPAGSFLAKVDLAKYYTQLAVLEQHCSLFGIEWGGVWYEFTSLPFGFSLAPAFASWVSGEIAAIARSRGIPVVATYLDDFLLASPTAAASAADLAAFLALLRELGVEYGDDKVEGPSQSLTFLGVGIDTVQQRLWLAPSAVEAFSAALAAASSAPSIPCKQLQSLTGKLAWFASIMPHLRWYARPLYNLLPADLASPVSVPPAACTPLIAALRESLGTTAPILAWRTPAPAVLLRTDASGEIGYGGHIGVRAFARPWRPSWVSCKSMTAKELWPIAEALRLFPGKLRNRTLLAAVDNSSAVFALCRGQSACPPSQRVLGRIIAAAARLNCTIIPVHLPRAHNFVADGLSRFSRPWSGDLPPSGSCAGLPGYSPEVAPSASLRPQRSALGFRVTNHPPRSG